MCVYLDKTVQNTVYLYINPTAPRLHEYHSIPTPCAPINIAILKGLPINMSYLYVLGIISFHVVLPLYRHGWTLSIVQHAETQAFCFSHISFMTWLPLRLARKLELKWEVQTFPGLDLTQYETKSWSKRWTTGLRSLRTMKSESI